MLGHVWIFNDGGDARWRHLCSKRSAVDPVVTFSMSAVTRPAVSNTLLFPHLFVCCLIVSDTKRLTLLAFPNMEILLTTMHTYNNSPLPSTYIRPVYAFAPCTSTTRWLYVSTTFNMCLTNCNRRWGCAGANAVVVSGRMVAKLDASRFNNWAKFELSRFLFTFTLIY